MPILDPRPPRPLTSNEISKILCSILSTVGAVDPTQVNAYKDVLAASRVIVGLTSAGDVGRAILGIDRNVGATWRTAFAATVGGFLRWCERAEVTTAVIWIEENLDGMFPKLAEN